LTEPCRDGRLLLEQASIDIAYVTAILARHNLETRWRHWIP